MAQYEAWIAYPKNEDMEAETAISYSMEEAERMAIEESAVNCHRTVTVLEFGGGPGFVVKGPYHLKPERL